MSDRNAAEVPDTATTYERADPLQQSPSGKLTAPVPVDDKKADDLKQNEAPSKPQPAPANQSPPAAASK